MKAVPTEFRASPTKARAFTDGYKKGLDNAVLEAQELVTQLTGAAQAVPIYRPGLGVYSLNITESSHNTRKTRFEEFLNWPIDVGSDFGARGTWAEIGNTSWFTFGWRDWIEAQPGRNVCITIGLLPPDGSTLAQVAAGNFNSTWNAIADEFYNRRLRNIYIRIGHEMDLAAFPWHARESESAQLKTDYRNAFRKVVETMRARQPANNWKFIVCPTCDWYNVSYLTDIWPGDDVTDILGLDIYDQSWLQENGSYLYPWPAGSSVAEIERRWTKVWDDQHIWYLNNIKNFAAARGKKTALCEWGVARRTGFGADKGGLDNYIFIQKMYDWIHDPANLVDHHVYFDVRADVISEITSPTTEFPNAAAKFKETFGATL